MICLADIYRRTSAKRIANDFISNVGKFQALPLTFSSEASAKMQLLWQHEEERNVTGSRYLWNETKTISTGNSFYRRPCERTLVKILSIFSLQTSAKSSVNIPTDVHRRCFCTKHRQKISDHKTFVGVSIKRWHLVFKLLSIFVYSGITNSLKVLSCSSGRSDWKEFSRKLVRFKNLYSLNGRP